MAGANATTALSASAAAPIVVHGPSRQGLGAATAGGPLRQHVELRDCDAEHLQGARRARRRPLHPRRRQPRGGRHLSVPFSSRESPRSKRRPTWRWPRRCIGPLEKRRSVVLEGHSFLTEGVTPLGRNYFDGRYIESIHRRFGSRPMRTYPLMTFSRFMFWTAVARIQKCDRSGTSRTPRRTRAPPGTRYGWQYYGGHHLENRMTAFYHGIYLPQKFGADMRNNRSRRGPAWGRVARSRLGGVQHPAGGRRRAARVLQEATGPHRRRIHAGSWRSRRALGAEFPTYKRRSSVCGRCSRVWRQRISSDELLPEVLLSAPTTR